MKGKYLGKDKESPEAHEIWECPYCGKVTYHSRWGRNGIVIVKDVLGCKHWAGDGDVEEYFEKEVRNDLLDI